MRWFVRVVIVILLVPAALFAWMFLEACSQPLVRRADIALPGLAPGAAVRIALMSDIHIGTAAMGPKRLSRIVRQVNALHPDLIAIGGDFIFGKDPDGATRLGEAMVAPLKQLRAPLGVVAVLGNHDYATGEAVVRRELAAAGIPVVENGAIVRGPLALGGVGDDASGHADLAATLRAARALGRPIVLLTHSPDVAPALPPDAPLLLAGHTHCGQGVLFGRPLAYEPSRYGARYRCGLIREGARTVVVTAGLGASNVPLRLGARPDIWLLTLRGTAGAK